MANNIGDIVLSDSWYLYEDKVVFSTVFADCILETNLTECSCNMLGNYFDDSTYRLHPYCIILNQKIYLLPDKANDIIVFNLEGKEIKRIMIENPAQKRIQIRNYYIFGTNAYLISNGLAVVIRLDSQNDSIEMSKICDNDSEMFLGSSSINYHIYIISSHNNIYKYDGNEFKKIANINVDDVLNVICCAKGKIYLSGKKKILYAYSENNKKCEELNELPNEFYVNEPGNDGVEHFIFDRAVVVGNEIWFMHNYGSMDVCFNVLSNSAIGFAPKNVKYVNYDEAWHSPLSVFLYLREGRYIGKMVDATSEIYEIDTLRKTSIHYDLKMSSEFWKKYMKIRILHENSDYGLENFITDAFSDELKVETHDR